MVCEPNSIHVHLCVVELFKALLLRASVVFPAVVSSVNNRYAARFLKAAPVAYVFHGEKVKRQRHGT